VPGVIRRLLLWDIDGTLLRAGSVGAAVFDEAITAVVGRPPAERVRMSGKTDPKIVGEYLAQMGVTATDGTLDAVLGALAAGMAAAAGRLADEGAACPGVPELLACLAADRRLVNGVLTGNIASNALVKLAAFGLDGWLDLDAAAYGSDDADRTRLVPVACARVAARHGVELAPDDVWVIGDTPSDLACARAVGARCVLVATGRYALAELSPLGADAVLPDLADVDGVVALLTAGL
jgi:phosphoglycolate phosphatase